MSSKSKKKSLFEPKIVKKALWDSVKKLNPIYQIKNPVMFVVEVGSVLTTLLFFHAILTGKGEASPGFILQISIWLWITVLFANFAESMAEGRGKAQADSLRQTRREVMAKRLAKPAPDAEVTKIVSSQLKKGDVVLVEAGDIIPMDGEIIEGVASVNESAVTGESAPVIRESGGDRSAVTGGTTVLSDWLRIRITVQQGETFIDRMIALVEGAERQKTPNEIALNILLAGLTIVFLLAVCTLLPYSIFAVRAGGSGQ